MALLALTTLGVDSADTVNAVVKVAGPRALRTSGNLRLVVQSYDGAHGEIPGKGSRPIASMQRAVTAKELRDGVRVSLVELRGSRDDARGARSDGATGKPIVMAWVESGPPDLEYDARRARPLPGSMYGVAVRHDTEDCVQISLSQRA